MLYIQKSVSENEGNCSHRGRKIQKFSGGKYPQNPFYHFSTLGIVWSLFADAPPPPPTDEFLKNALMWIIACGSSTQKSVWNSIMVKFELYNLIGFRLLLLLLLQYFSRKLHSQQGDFQAGPTR
jgi:hypothetical protein